MKTKFPKSTRVLSTSIASVFAVAATLASGKAATIYWDATTALWSDVAAWSTSSGLPTPNPAAVPGASDTA